MSDRERPDEEVRVSPYLLRPARTYEEYLRDKAVADRVQKQLRKSATLSVNGRTKNHPAETDNSA